MRRLELQYSDDVYGNVTVTCVAETDADVKEEDLYEKVAAVMEKDAWQRVEFGEVR